jgi:hypothetical protein
MSDVNTYAEELVNIFGFSFPLPPVYLNARPDSEIYSHHNSSSETITPASYAALTPTDASALPAGQARHVRFNIPIDHAQEELSNEGFWVHYPRIIPGGINTEYVSLQNIINSFSYHFLRLVMLRFTKYNYNDVPGGHTLGHCLSAVRATDIQYTVTTTQSPGEKKTYATHLAALECLYAFAPPVEFTGYLTLDRPSWLLFLGQHTLQKVVRVGDVVYVDHSGFYAGGVVVEVFRPLREDFGFHRLLVKGAWIERAKPGEDGAYFYLLVTGGMCSKIKRAYAGRWILDEHPHDQIDPTYRGTFRVDQKSDKLNYSTAWVKDHVTVMETAKEAQRAAQEARTRRVEKELWGRSRVRTAA